MKFLIIGFTLFIMVNFVRMDDVNYLERKNILDDILVYPVAAPVALVKKREAFTDISENINDILLEKLSEHSQALEHLVKTVDHQDEINRLLLDRLSRILDKPKLPAKLEIKKAKEQSGRRSNSNNGDEGNFLFRIGKNIPIYGRLAKHLFMEEIHSDTDPTPIVEKNPDELTEYNRRSFDGGPGVDLDQTSRNEPSPWCEEAILCKKNGQPICGFDDKYGYGKFDDLCHMLNVNCFYRYNFALAHTCHPTL